MKPFNIDEITISTGCSKANPFTLVIFKKEATKSPHYNNIKQLISMLTVALMGCASGLSCLLACKSAKKVFQKKKKGLRINNNRIRCTKE